MYAVIMAGGKGTRFWPLSRGKKPKHLLNITGEKSIIQYTVDRVTPLVEKDGVLIVTSASHSDEIREQLPRLPAENILIEPVGRNTAPCIGLAAIHIRKRSPDAVMFVLPSDHLIADTKSFLASLTTAREMAKKDNCLVTIGIKPEWPETGYGYMERGKIADTIGETRIYGVRSFREKPDLATAETFFKDGGFFWNSGMFIWKASAILDTIKRLIPELYEGLLMIEKSIGTEHEKDVLSKVYRDIKSVSIDYGVMEKTRDVFMIEGNFGWNDIGSWDALWDVMDKDEMSNATRGDIITFDTSNSLIYSPEKMVALIGVKDLIVVETEDSLLICKRGASQDVRKVVGRLEKKDMKEYL
ncbi:MAG: mannose-1-phosphate guanylyltransferase [Thermodesulfobacteriota bacterium]|nr:mannose-1-phosphate guanylyltransferase [Thermodesulfobacteriota bacterium]